MILYLGMVHSIRFEADGISAEVRSATNKWSFAIEEGELSRSVSTIGGISFEEVKPLG